MPGIDDAAIRFMTDLQQNNNPEWFDANRERYQRDLRDPMKELLENLRGPVSLLVPEAAVPKLSRINNDVRFHKDRPPYKQHMWIKWKRPPAELMLAVGRQGWTAVLGISGAKKEELNDWRRNLRQHTSRWRRYAASAGIGDEVAINLRDPYKKPLFDDIPEDLFELVQAKSLHLVTDYRASFSDSPEGDVLTELARLLPAFYFATESPTRLPTVLDELGAGIQPPNSTIREIWEAVKTDRG